MLANEMTSEQLHMMASLNHQIQSGKGDLATAHLLYADLLEESGGDMREVNYHRRKARVEWMWADWRRRTGQKVWEDYQPGDVLPDVIVDREGG